MTLQFPFQEWQDWRDWAGSWYAGDFVFSPKSNALCRNARFNSKLLKETGTNKLPFRKSETRQRQHLPTCPEPGDSAQKLEKGQKTPNSGRI
jgi:hypothetical protein